MRCKCERSCMQVPRDWRETLCAPGRIADRGERSGMGHTKGGKCVGAGERSGGGGCVEGRSHNGNGSGEHAQRS
jgi:hypothetical protein